MPIAIRLQSPNADGTKIRVTQELTVDYADAASLPSLVRFNRTVWERVGGASSVRYRPEIRSIVDLEAEGKILDV